MYLYLHLAQTGKVPVATINMLWGLPVTTWLTLAGLVIAVVLAFVKLRKNDHDALHKTLAGRFDAQLKATSDGLPCGERLDSLNRLSDELASLRKTFNLLSSSQAAYYDWIMEGGVPKLILRVAETEQKMEQVIRLVDAYSEWQSGPGSLGAPPKVLLVEDNPSDVALARRAFERAGVTKNMHCVGSAEETLTAISQGWGQGVVVLDHHLPGMSGEAMLEELHSDGKLLDMRVVVVSGGDVPPRVHELADIVVGKPLDVGEIMKALRYQNLERHRAGTGEA